MIAQIEITFYVGTKPEDAVKIATELAERYKTTVFYSIGFTKYTVEYLKKASN